MPRLSAWMIRASLLHLLAGFSIGALLLFHKGFPLSSALWGLLPIHINLLLIGWIVQLVLGTAFWILPRFSRPPLRGNVRLAWLAFGLLNAGILLIASGSASGLPALTAAGRAAQFAALVSFLIHAWPRIK